MIWNAWMLALVLAPFPPAAADAEKTHRTDHAVVTYAGVGEAHAAAIAQVVQAARNAAVEQGFDLPDTVAVSVRCDGAGRAGLFNDGQDRLFLTVRSERDLRRPQYSGIFVIYGLCHEVAHLAMYRPIRDHSWMTSAAAEGWAHWLGSRLVDAVYGKLGEAAWPDRYDYRADGMQRLKRQLASRPGDVARGAGQWMKLAEVLGEKELPKLLAAWGKAEIDPTDPAAALRRTLLDGRDDAETRKPLADWWNESEKLLVFPRPKSALAARTFKPAELAGSPEELARDDGQPAGKNSFAGGGHAVRFEAQGDAWCMTAVKIHGSRYGYPQAPKEDFHVYLCDGEFRQIADFPVPYAKFPYGSPDWVMIPVTPTQVPPTFIVCVGFNPTATKGVFVSRDKEGGGACLTGLPGEEGRSFSQGDWLIRAVVDQLRDADPLKAPR